MQRLHLIPAVVLATLTMLPSPARASAPAGVWALVDGVTLEPDGKNPTLIRIDGVIMIANVLPDFPDYGGYSVPQRGYMYYSCEDKQLTTCVMEWQELLAIAGTADNCRGWGSNALPDNGSLRPPKVPPADPDLYPIAQGIVPGFSPCEALRKWEMDNVEATTGGPDSEGDTDASSTSIDPSGDGTTTADPGTTSGDAGTASPDPTTGPATSGDGPTTGDAPATGTGSLTGEPGGETGATASAGSTGAGESTGGAPIDDGKDTGCACNGGGGGPGPLALAGLALLGLVRRRR